MNQFSTKDLFDLVASLSKTEKRYVTLFLSRHYKNSVSAKLFLDVVRYKNEETFKNKIENSKHIAYNKNIRYSKHLLYKQILKALKEYATSVENHDLQLQEIYQLCVVLRDRKLYGQTKKLLLNGIKLAEKKGKYNYMGIFFKFLSEVTEFTFNRKEYQQLLSLGHQQLLFAERSFEVIKQTTIKNALVYRTTSIGFNQNTNEIDLLDYLDSIGKDLKNKTPNYFNNSLLQSNFIKVLTLLGRHEKAGIEAKKIFAKIKKIDSKNFTNEQQYNFITLIKEISTAYLYAKNWQGLENCVGLLQKIKSTNLFISEIIYQRMCIIKLNLYFETNQYAKCEGVILEVEENTYHILEKNQATRFLFTTTKIKLLLISGRYSSATKQILLFLKSSKELRLEFQITIRFYLIICFFELGQFGNLQSEITSLRRFLAKNNQKSVYYKLINFFIKSHRMDIDNGKKKYFLARQQDLFLQKNHVTTDSCFMRWYHTHLK